MSETELFGEQVETLAVELREREIARQLAADPDCIASADTPRTIARDVIASDWLADHDRKVQAQALQDAAGWLATLGHRSAVTRLRARADRLTTGGDQ